MKRNTVAIISMISIVLSPLFGGLVGKIIGCISIMGFGSIWTDDGLCCFGIIAWMVASVLFYIHFKNASE